MIEAITAALNRGVASIARTGEYGARQSILRTAQAGERDVSTLERIALLQLSCHSKNIAADCRPSQACGTN
jgi:hypothetical protein